MPSSGLCGHQAYTWYTCRQNTHTYKTFCLIKKSHCIQVIEADSDSTGHLASSTGLHTHTQYTPMCVHEQHTHKHIYTLSFDQYGGEQLKEKSDIDFWPLYTHMDPNKLYTHRWQMGRWVSEQTKTIENCLSNYLELGDLKITVLCIFQMNVLYLFLSEWRKRILSNLPP